MVLRYLRQGHHRSSKDLLQLWLPQPCRQNLEDLPRDTPDKILQTSEITTVEIRIMAEITTSQSGNGHGKTPQRLQQRLHEVGDRDQQPPRHRIKTLAQENVGNHLRL